jgi:hypothetical protein
MRKDYLITVHEVAVHETKLRCSKIITIIFKSLCKCISTLFVKKITFVDLRLHVNEAVARQSERGLTHTYTHARTHTTSLPNQSTNQSSFMCFSTIVLQVAYKEWLCVTTMAFGNDENYQPTNVTHLPCRSYCDRVARLCPYLSPHAEFSYAGEPAFSCIGEYQYVDYPIWTVLSVAGVEV